jgi:hypothetical protein
VPARVLEVGGDEADPFVARKGALGDGEERRVQVDAGARGLREPFQQPGGDAAGAAGEVEHAGRGADQRLDHVEHDREALLAVGQVPLLLPVPALLPGLPVGAGRGRVHVRHRLITPPSRCT